MSEFGGDISQVEGEKKSPDDKEATFGINPMESHRFCTQNAAGFSRFCAGMAAKTLTTLPTTLSEANKHPMDQVPPNGRAARGLGGGRFSAGA